MAFFLPKIISKYIYYIYFYYFCRKIKLKTFNFDLL